ncbi:MAG: DNA helicase UvrD [Thaumarchaeota archaeon]|nr:DNA helicase UvrD [Nitrososphaerota archaeon]
MRIITDLHIHSRFSAATSQTMDLRSLALNAKIKGLDLLGTGDALHPKWLKELTEELEPLEDGTYVLKNTKEQKPCFLVSTEVSTIYEKEGKARKVHHIILLPDLEAAAQLADKLKTKGNVNADGRPSLSMTAPELVESVKEVDDRTEIFPAHVWTPWFSIFGANNSFNTIEECYEDQSDHIHALETGLSSDPPMNWRLSRLDRYVLVSNSDCHSPLPHRLGREANIFELSKPSYREIVSALRKSGNSKLASTIETRPEYGKYHWTGHRSCNVSLAPSDALKHGNHCPRCGRKLTLGVEQRVEDLADRPVGFTPREAAGYVYLIPLHELLATVLGAASIATRKVQQVYNDLVNRFGSEYNVMLSTQREELATAAGNEVATAIEAVRKNTLKVTPGYDGVYGVVDYGGNKNQQNVQKRTGSKNPVMDDYL